MAASLIRKNQACLDYKRRKNKVKEKIQNKFNQNQLFQFKNNGE